MTSPKDPSPTAREKPTLRLTVPEVAAELRQCTRYVYGLINRKAIGHVREGRKLFITRAQLDEYQAAKEVPAISRQVTDLEAARARAQVRSVPGSRSAMHEEAKRLARERGWS